MATVLCTGVDRVLIETRALILRQAGHTVVTATGEAELVAACANREIDIAVIGQAISHTQKRRVFNLVRQHCPTARLLELYQPHDGRVLSEADAWLEVPAQIPSDLAENVGRLARNASS